MEKKKFNILVNFEGSDSITSDLITLVLGDYNAVELNFQINIAGTRTVFFLVKPNGKKYVATINNNKLTIDDKNIFNQVGNYFYSIAVYDNDSKLSNAQKGVITVVDNNTSVEQSDVEDADNYSILNDLIAKVESIQTTYNQNAEEKLNEFNDNYQNKLTEIEDNLNTQLEPIMVEKKNEISDYVSNQMEEIAGIVKTDFKTELNAEGNVQIEKIKKEGASYENDIKNLSNKINRVENDLFDSAQATGSSIKVEDSTLSEFKEITIDGECKQITTKGINHYVNAENILFDTASSIDSVENLNSYDGYNNVVHIKGAITYCKIITSPMSNVFANSVKAGDAITVIALIKKAQDVTTQLYYNWQTISETYMSLNKYKDLSNGWAYYYATFTFKDDASDFMPRLHFSTSGEIYIAKIQVSLGNTPGDFEPYTYGQPSPSPNYLQPISTIEHSFNITSCNKNLFDKNRLVNGTWDTPNVSQRVILFDKKVKIGEQFTITNNNNNYQFSIGFAKLNECITNNTIYNESGWKTDKSYTIIAQGNGYLFLQISKLDNSNISPNEINNSDFQIEEGSITTSYVQHLQSQITANLPEGEFVGKFDDTDKDTVGVKYNEEDGKYHLILNKMINRIILDGSENWSVSSNTNYNEFLCIIKGLGASKYKQTKSNYSLYIDNNRIAISNETIYWRIPIECAITTVDELKTLLSSNNAELYYLLANPYEVDLGVIDMPLTYYPITHLFTDSDLLPTINAKYYRDFKNTIKTMQDNLISDNAKITTLENDVNTLKEQVSQLMTSTTSEIEESEVINNDI